MKHSHVFVLTGAGISAESGIPVFRSETGLWENHRVEDVAEYSGFMRDKNFVHNFYNTMRASLKTKEPNLGHRALVTLEDFCNDYHIGFTLVTQNIDNLHEKAGSKKVIHMHGELNSILCEACNKRYPYFEDCSDSVACKFCGKKALRPDIVWFGEVPYYMDLIEQALSKTTLFLAIGASVVVYPVAGFCAYARSHLAKCIEFNLEKSQVASNFDTGYYGKASETLPKFVDEFIKSIKDNT